MSADAEAYLRISGHRRLTGEIRVNGAKNAALPCLAAALLSDEPSQITRVPDIEDVHRLIEILTTLGVEAGFEGNEVVVRPLGVCGGSPPDELAASLRASFLVMGPLLARAGEASCGAPGGDVIGARPLDVHLAGFRAFGAQVDSVGGRTIAHAPEGLRGATIVLDYPSVLGTENLLLAAVLASGRTRIVNAAMEPEIGCLADMLNAMGARISGAGHHTITVDGVERLSGVVHELIPDRIETGTLMIAAAATRGDVRLTGVSPSHLEALLSKFAEIGVDVRRGDDELELSVNAGATLTATNVQALPYPGFATDLQAPITALLTGAAGTSMVHERVFENRMQHLNELRKLGANIVAGGSVSAINGPAALSGAVVRGTDIRATAALIVAAFAAEGESRVYGMRHLARGYADLPAQLAALGADIERV
ncbi:MAG: UDP-N-acetylglucosamine 1-carboxyvinyltransferase [Chloroflexi bacterium]|nr:UDP-N-acetylglucosamine 1-carboxyvinyltransferase [Chloroflexota bacterium]